MFAYNPQPMFVFNLGTLAILEVNNAALEQYGYTRDEFLSMTMRDISPVEEMMADAKDTGTQPQYQTSGNWWHLKKSGEIMHVEITSHLLEYNGTKACHMQIYDVTKIRKAWDYYKFIETVLSRADFKVIRAENGVEAVNICYNNADVGLVLMDLKMPVMGGIEATRQIKNFLPDLPVIALTAFVSSEDEQEAFVSGCKKYLKKPVDRLHLLASVGDLLENKAN